MLVNVCKVKSFNGQMCFDHFQIKEHQRCLHDVFYAVGLFSMMYTPDNICLGYTVGILNVLKSTFYCDCF